jgi:phenazine biosynthesis protein phzE
VQRQINLYGRDERVGFYNTFTAWSDHDQTQVEGIGTIDIGRDPVTGEVHALHGPWFASLQFHAESVLTRNGPRILAATIERTLGR